MQIAQNRRAPGHRSVRNLVLTGNLLATLLEQAGADAENAYSRSIRIALEAWEHAVEGIRKEQAPQPAPEIREMEA